jgi:hypothetical protein
MVSFHQFLSVFLTKTFYAFLMFLVRAAGPVNLIFLNLIVLIILGLYYKLWSFLFNFLQPPATFSLLGTNILFAPP